MAKRYTYGSAKAYTLAAALWGIAICAAAQQPFQYQYSVEDDKLPMAEVIHTFFSRAGELWATYGSGEYLSRFDGVNWTHYSLSALGLPASLNYQWEDDYGIWWISQAHEPSQVACYTHKGTWETYQFDSKVIRILRREGREGAFIGSYDFYEYRFDPKAKCFVRGARLPVTGAEKYLRLAEVSLDGKPYLVTATGLQGPYYFRYGPDFQYHTPIPPDCRIAPLVLEDGRTEAVLYSDREYQWYHNGYTYPIKVILPGGTQGEIVNIVMLYPWNTTPAYNGLLARSSSDNRFYLYAIEGLDSLRLLMSHVPGNAARCYAQDPQGNWWVGTSTGIMRTDGNLLTFSETSPEMVNGLHAIGEDAEGRIWMGGYNGQGGFSVFDGKKLSRYPMDDIPTPVLPGSLLNKSGVLYFFTERLPGLVRIQDGALSLMNVEGRKDHTLGYYFRPLSNGRIALGLSSLGLGIAEERAGRLDNLRLIDKDKGMDLHNVLTISEDARGRLWLGRFSQGLALYDPQRDTAVTWLRSPDVAGSIGAMSSLVDEQGTLWLGSHNGVYQLPQAHRFDYLKGSVFPHLRRVHLPGGDTSTVYLMNNTDDHIVFGTQKAVYFWDKKYRGPRPRIFSLRFGRDIAGSGGEQNAVLADSKGYLWIGTQEGATRIDLKNLRFDTSATRIRLSAFQAGDAPVAIEGEHIGKVPVRKRNIRFAFLPSGNTFLKDDLFFDVIVIDARGDTLFQRLSTREKEHHMDYVPPGQYLLRITAYKHNVLSGEADFRFVVPRQLDEKPWFWLGLAALILAIPFLWYQNRKREQQLLLRQQIAAEQSKREQDSLKMQALSNFFNPHFINNALHWVQSRYRKDPETTQIIGKLADNVEVLYHNTYSGKAWHSLARELEVVRNYLLIQQVRFENTFSVELTLPEDAAVLESIHSPAMLVQIHVENAIEKGIRKRQGACRFALRVECAENACDIFIEDDGSGRSPEPQPKARKGSTMVMDELIQLLNAYNPHPITVRYEDGIYTTEAGEPYGTRVTIHLPKHYRYEFSQMERFGH